MSLIFIISNLFVTFSSHAKGFYDESGEFVFQEYLRWNYSSTNPNCITPSGRSPCQDIRLCNFAAASLFLGGRPSPCGWVGKGVPKMCCELPLILGYDLLKIVESETAINRACGTNFLPSNLSSTQNLFMEIAESLVPINFTAPWIFDPPLDMSPHYEPPKPPKSNSRQGEFPWMVSVRKRGTHICAGGLISRKHVLTAAVCIRNDPKVKQYVVHVGNLFADKGYPINVSKISTYPEFAFRGLYNELALLTLAQEILIPQIPSICVPDPSNDENILGKTATLLRWGLKTTKGGKTRQWICVTEEVRIVTFEKCKRQGLDAIREELIGDYVCAELTQTDNNRCKSGVGGLLMLQERNKKNSIISWFLIAMDTREAKKNAANSQYKLFTRVSSYMDWIEKEVAKYLPLNNITLSRRSSMSLING